jgi:hydroxymethylpyrimidine/phosphomethylpyrimidine kinase / thiaminase
VDALCSLLGAKSPEYDDLKVTAQTVLSIIEESTMHRSFCSEWGITTKELDSTSESPACTAYGAYIIDIGLRGLSSLYVLPCLC